MAKETFADKMARKAFEKADFQKSWQVHMAMFRPILEPAFEGNYQAKIHLCAALNRISQRDLKGGLDKLQLLKGKCETSADRAAWLFFAGLCFDMAGQTEQMLLCYRGAEQEGHRFYMPHIKVAKFYQQGCMYDRAEEYFRKAIACFDGMGLGDQDKLILGSAYASLATCQTMMHQYDEAQKTLDNSRILFADGPGRSAVEAVLYAALGETEKTEAALAVLQSHAPQVYSEIKASTERILNGTDPMFCKLEIDQAKILDFWVWFREQESFLAEKPEEGAKLISERLNELFPFGDQELEAAIFSEASGLVVLLPYCYSVALSNGYEELLFERPDDLESKWKFQAVPYIK